jgi:hypothetical protein
MYCGISAVLHVHFRHRMQKKNSKIALRPRQRQKLKRKMVLVAAASFTCIVIVLTVLFQTSRVDKSMAGVNIYTVVEAEPVIEKTLDAPVLKQMPVIGLNTIMVRPVKASRTTAQNNPH